MALPEGSHSAYFWKRPRIALSLICAAKAVHLVICAYACDSFVCLFVRSFVLLFVPPLALLPLPPLFLSLPCPVCSSLTPFVRLAIFMDFAGLMSNVTGASVQITLSNETSDRVNVIGKSSGIFQSLPLAGGGVNIFAGDGFLSISYNYYSRMADMNTCHIVLDYCFFLCCLKTV